MFLLSRARPGAAARRTSGGRGGGPAAAAAAAPLATARPGAAATTATPTILASSRAAADALAPRPPPRRRRLRASRPLSVPVSAIFIDRRAALERAWQRQQRAADLELADPPRGGVLEVRSLAHLERILERAGSSASLVVALFFSRSCGACGRAREALDALAAEAGSSRTRSAFVCVDVRDEYDHASAAARLYSVRAVPSFAFFVDGALVRRLPLRDVRALAYGRSAAQIRAALEEDVAGVRRAYRAVVMKAAPSAGARGSGGEA